MTDREAVLFANEAFYSAFARADIQAMDALWAREGPVVCIHPGWNSITTRERVLASWQDIFLHGDTSAIRFHNAEPYVFGDFALVICYEAVPGNFLIATNVFRRDTRGWCMVHHQAGRVNARPPEPPTPDVVTRPH